MRRSSREETNYPENFEKNESKEEDHFNENISQKRKVTDSDKDLDLIEEGCEYHKYAQKDLVVKTKLINKKFYTRIFGSFVRKKN